MVMRLQARRMASAAVVVLALAAACGEPDPSAEPSRTEEPSASASPASPAPSSVPGVAELEATGEPLEAGTYTRTGFEPTITLDLDGSWQAVQQATGFFDVQVDPGSPDVIAVQFARPDAIVGAEDGRVVATTAADAAAAVAANPDVQVIESGDSRIGGLDGLQVTVENSGDAHASVLVVPPGALGIDPGRRLWTAFFDTPDGLLAIMVGGSVATWDDALAAAEPVLESVRIGSVSD